MKHSMPIVISMLMLFFMSQVVGLYIVYKYVDTEKTMATGEVQWQPLPFGQERPDVAPSFSYVPIVIAIAAGTVLALLLVKFSWYFVWKLWFFLAVWYTVAIALVPIVRLPVAAAVIGLALGLYKLYGRNIMVKNITEVFIYAGIAVILVPVLNILSAIILLVLISIYDAWAVWKSGHMIILAKAQSSLKVFAGLQMPYVTSERVKVKQAKVTGKTKLHHPKTKTILTMKTAILGGGDIAFSLLFAGAVMGEFGFFHALVIPIFTTVALFFLFWLGQKNKFYPAMPFLSAACFLGYILLLFL